MRVPDSTGVIILSSAVLYPQALLPLFIFEPRYRTMLAEALDSHRMFCVAMQKPNDPRETPLPIAGLGLIRAAIKNPNGTSNVILQGVDRIRLGRVVRYKPYRTQEFEIVRSAAVDDQKIASLRDTLLDAVERQLSSGTAGFDSELLAQLVRTGGDTSEPVASALRALRHVDCPSRLADLVALLMVDSPLARQVLLQAVDVEDRLETLIQFLCHGVIDTPES